ncbi:MAG TPA: FHA domain-containing protein [Planctomycetota bacterium]|nr:FHA domain-containing protein [Planctomycetota bacterium]
MTDQVPVLLGTAGMVDGECFMLDRGIDIVVGRSRSCDVSLRRTAVYLKTPPAQRDNDHDFNTVSRRHLKITVSGTTASVQNLSTNGTFFNGEPMREPQKVDLAVGPCTVRLGTRESFQLLLLPKDDPRVKNGQSVSLSNTKKLSESAATE